MREIYAFVLFEKKKVSTSVQNLYSIMGIFVQHRVLKFENLKAFTIALFWPQVPPYPLLCSPDSLM